MLLLSIAIAVGFFTSELAKSYMYKCMYTQADRQTHEHTRTHKHTQTHAQTHTQYTHIYHMARTQNY